MHLCTDCGRLIFIADEVEACYCPFCGGHECLEYDPGYWPPCEHCGYPVGFSLYCPSCGSEHSEDFKHGKSVAIGLAAKRRSEIAHSAPMLAAMTSEFCQKIARGELTNDEAAERKDTRLRSLPQWIQVLVVIMATVIVYFSVIVVLSYLSPVRL